MIPYAQAMLEYGVDKPDLRNPIKIADVTEVFARDDVTFNAFKQVIKAGGVVRAIPAPGAAKQPRSFFDKLNDWAKGEGAPGLGYIIFEGEGEALGGQGADRQIPAARGAARRWSPRRSFQAGRRGVLRLRQGGQGGQARGRWRACASAMSSACRRRTCSSSAGSSTSRCTSGTRRRRRSTSPTIRSRCRRAGSRRSRRKDPLEIKAFQYDIVCNGIELSSGAIRNHRPDIMVKAFEIAGYGEDVLLEKFGGMYRAFQCGAPPHGGIAPGVDRIVMLLAGEENLREVVLFPMNQRAEDLLMGAPAPGDGEAIARAPHPPRRAGKVRRARQGDRRGAQFARQRLAQRFPQARSWARP